MAYYIRCSTDIYNVYLKYVEPRHIHVYSIDEVFIDITEYLSFYRQTPRELARTIVLDVENNRDHDNGRNRHQYVFVQSGDGHCGEA